MQRATKGNLKTLILNALEEAAAHYADVSGGMDLRDAPEHYLNVAIGNAVAAKFPRVGYKLEMPVRKMCEYLEIDDVCSTDDIRVGGRFDVVLTSRKSGAPRHVVEVKRSLGETKLLKDAKRLASLIDMSGHRQRLESNFIVSVARRSKSDRAIGTQEYLDGRVYSIEEELGVGFKVSGLYSVIEPPAKSPHNKDLVITVFVNSGVRS